MDQAHDICETRARTGASYAMLGMLFGCHQTTAWEIVTGKTYRTPEQRMSWGEAATPHDELTYEGWHRDMIPMPTIDLSIQLRYAAQNERDGHLRDAEYIASVAAWRGTDAFAAD